MIPDSERIVSDFLREHPAVAATGARIRGAHPDGKDMSKPWIRIVQLDATKDPRSRVEHLITFLMQLDCYAGDDTRGPSHPGGQPEANTIARTVRAALTDDLPGLRGDAVVSGVWITGDGRLPDTDLEPARERRVLTATVAIHNAPA
jgi:hypothetical protein